MKERDVILVVRVEDMKRSVVPAIKDICDGCKKPVWISKTMAKMPGVADMRLMCPQCMLEETTEALGRKNQEEIE